MTLHLPTFFDYVRRAPFGGRLSQTQVEGLLAVLSAAETQGIIDDRHTAYILATAFHETGGKMEPVREGFARTDAGARRAVAGRRYARPDAETGHVYYGRGLVQLTWKTNYRKVGEVLGLPLVANPDLMLDPAVSAKALVKGMADGLFTGRALHDYFGATTDDPVGARKIVNGTDKASLIAGYHRNFLDSIKAARERGERREAVGAPAAAVPAAVTADGPPLAKDKTAIGGVLAGLGGLAGAGSLIQPVLAGVTSPWALGAFAIIAIGVFLVLTGRLKLKLQGGV